MKYNEADVNYFSMNSPRVIEVKNNNEDDVDDKFSDAISNINELLDHRRESCWSNRGEVFYDAVDSTENNENLCDDSKFIENKQKMTLPDNMSLAINCNNNTNFRKEERKKDSGVGVGNPSDMFESSSRNNININKNIKAVRSKSEVDDTFLQKIDGQNDLCKQSADLEESLNKNDPALSRLPSSSKIHENTDKADLFTASKHATNSEIKDRMNSLFSKSTQTTKKTYRPPGGHIGGLGVQAIWRKAELRQKGEIKGDIRKSTLRGVSSPTSSPKPLRKSLNQLKKASTLKNDERNDARKVSIASPVGSSPSINITLKSNSQPTPAITTKQNKNATRINDNQGSSSIKNETIETNVCNNTIESNANTNSKNIITKNIADPKQNCQVNNSKKSPIVCSSTTGGLIMKDKNNKELKYKQSIDKKESTERMNQGIEKLNIIKDRNVTGLDICNGTRELEKCNFSLKFCDINNVRVNEQFNSMKSKDSSNVERSSKKIKQIKDNEIAFLEENSVVSDFTAQEAEKTSCLSLYDQIFKSNSQPVAAMVNDNKNSIQLTENQERDEIIETIDCNNTIENNSKSIITQNIGGAKQNCYSTNSTNSVINRNSSIVPGLKMKYKNNKELKYKQSIDKKESTEHMNQGIEKLNIIKDNDVASLDICNETCELEKHNSSPKFRDNNKLRITKQFNSINNKDSSKVERSSKKIKQIKDNEIADLEENSVVSEFPAQESEKTSCLSLYDQIFKSNSQPIAALANDNKNSTILTEIKEIDEIKIETIDCNNTIENNAITNSKNIITQNIGGAKQNCYSTNSKNSIINYNSSIVPGLKTKDKYNEGNYKHSIGKTDYEECINQGVEKSNRIDTSSITKNVDICNGTHEFEKLNSLLKFCDINEMKTGEQLNTMNHHDSYKEHSPPNKIKRNKDNVMMGLGEISVVSDVTGIEEEQTFTLDKGSTDLANESKNNKLKTKIKKKVKKIKDKSSEQLVRQTEGISDLKLAKSDLLSTQMKHENIDGKKIDKLFLGPCINSQIHNEKEVSLSSQSRDDNKKLSKSGTDNIYSANKFGEINDTTFNCIAKTTKCNNLLSYSASEQSSESSSLISSDATDLTVGSPKIPIFTADQQRNDPPSLISNLKKSTYEDNSLKTTESTKKTLKKSVTFMEIPDKELIEGKDEEIDKKYENVKIGNKNRKMVLGNNQFDKFKPNIKFDKTSNKSLDGYSSSDSNQNKQSRIRLRQNALKSKASDYINAMQRSFGKQDVEVLDRKIIQKTFPSKNSSDTNNDRINFGKPKIKIEPKVREMSPEIVPTPDVKPIIVEEKESEINVESVPKIPVAPLKKKRIVEMCDKACQTEEPYNKKIVISEYENMMSKLIKGFK